MYQIQNLIFYLTLRTSLRIYMTVYKFNIWLLMKYDIYLTPLHWYKKCMNVLANMEWCYEDDVFNQIPEEYFEGLSQRLEYIKELTNGGVSEKDAAVLYVFSKLVSEGKINLDYSK